MFLLPQPILEEQWWQGRLDPIHSSTANSRASDVGKEESEGEFHIPLSTSEGGGRMGGADGTLSFYGKLEHA